MLDAVCRHRAGRSASSAAHCEGVYRPEGVGARDGTAHEKREANERGD